MKWLLAALGVWWLVSRSRAASAGTVDYTGSSGGGTKLGPGGESPAPLVSVTPASCDLNHDGYIDGMDWNIMLQALGSVPGNINWNPACDLDGDGKVTKADEDILLSYYGQAI